MKNKVGVQKELEEAEVNYELKKKDYENMVAALNKGNRLYQSFAQQRGRYPFYTGRNRQSSKIATG